MAKYIMTELRVDIDTKCLGRKTARGTETSIHPLDVKFGIQEVAYCDRDLGRLQPWHEFAMSVFGSGNLSIKCNGMV